MPSAAKRGFDRSKDGLLQPIDALSDYAYRLGVDDDLKFRKNKKTYQEISFEQLGFSFRKEEYIFNVADSDRKFIKDYLKSKGAQLGKSKKTIGINTGSGHRFAGKRLPAETQLLLIEKFGKALGAQIFLLGGEDELERNEEIRKRSLYPVIATGSHSLKRFAAIVEHCDLVVSGDTTAMHVAIAAKVPVVAYFGSTCASEIELYGRGAKIVSDIDCSPCYKKICPIDEECMKKMDAELIFKAAQEFL